MIGTSLLLLRQSDRFRQKSVGVSALKTENAIPSKGTTSFNKTETERKCPPAVCQKQSLAPKRLLCLEKHSAPNELTAHSKIRTVDQEGPGPYRFQGITSARTSQRKVCKSDDKSRGCNMFRRSLLPLPRSTSTLKLYGQTSFLRSKQNLDWGQSGEKNSNLC